jgi:beta-glucosidase
MFFFIKVMKLIPVVITFGMILNGMEVGVAQQTELKFRNTDLTFEERVDDLISRMTLDEKVSQMQHSAAAIERLGIPEYNWWNECLHGVGRAGTATVFPQAIGLGATWNPDLVFLCATITSDEARAKHHEFVRRGERGIYKGLTFWTPNINIFRDPRWGRGQETYGEDPYLTSRLGVAFVKGLQGEHSRYLKLVATPKHFAVHSGLESERHSFDVNVSERDLWMTYLPAFKSTVREGKAASVMGAYNRFRGDPCCASPLLLEEILRRQWGFDGYVVSDCGAISDIYRNHKVVTTAEEAAARGVEAGCDLNCGSVYSVLAKSVEKGHITEKDIDQSLRRLFMARMRLGMFDPPEMVPYTSISIKSVCCDAHRAVNREIARESMVLLKNSNKLLPLSDKTGSIAVIGPHADAVRILLGNYHGTPGNPVTLLQGIRNRVGAKTVVHYAQGCELLAIQSPKVIPTEALIPPEGSSEKHGLRGEYFNNTNFEGAAALTRIDSKLSFRWGNRPPDKKVNRDNYSVRWTGQLLAPKSGGYVLRLTGDDGFRLFLDGKLLIEDWTDHAPRSLEARITLEAAKKYDLKIEYYERQQGAELRFAWLVPGPDPIEEAVAAAQKSDVVIAAMGISTKLEDEGRDRSELGLPEVQLKLLKKLHQTGKPVVLVLFSGSAIAVNWADEHIPAILQAWYPGEEGGNAIADVLFGDYNPAGRLPVTVYKSIEQLPPFRDYDMKNRTYRYFTGEPLYPFGHGLSYTTFKYDKLTLEPSKITTSENCTVSVDVSNTGDVAGDEVVQLYIRNKKAGADDPIRQLKGFTRINLKPAEKQCVSFLITPEHLSIYGDDGRWGVEPGEYEISIGGRQPGHDEVTSDSHDEIVFASLVVK